MGFKLLGVSVVPERWGYEKRRPGKCNRSTPIAGGSVIPPSDRLIVVERERGSGVPQTDKSGDWRY